MQNGSSCRELNIRLVYAGPAYNKVALVGEIAVPCTCNPL